MVVGEFGISRDFAGEIENEFGGSFAKCGRTVFVRRVRPESRANHRPTRRQRSPRPPDVKRGDVPMPDGFLAPRVRRNPLDRQVNFNEAFGVGHVQSNCPCLPTSGFRAASRCQRNSIPFKGTTALGRSAPKNSMTPYR